MAKQRRTIRRRKPRAKRPAILARSSLALADDLRSLIYEARSRVAQTVNAGLVLLYWEIGRRIRTEILKATRGSYGDEILSTLSKELSAEFGPGYSVPNLSRMLRFAENFPQLQIVSTLSTKLGWSHFVELIPIDDPLKRDFYAEMCRAERWSVRTLRTKLQSLMFERTALSKKPEKLIKQELGQLRDKGELTPDLVFRDPYFLDFLGLADTYAEKDLEAAILRQLEHFLLELGAGFAFVQRQKRMVIDGEDFFLDLLFYHRELKRLIAIDLKIGKFSAADKGQMELYLRWLDKHERRPDEQAPLGLILCADKAEEQIELLQLDRSGIRVASYLTELPARELLHKKLHEAMILARAAGVRRLMSRKQPTDIKVSRHPMLHSINRLPIGGSKTSHRIMRLLLAAATIVMIAASPLFAADPATDMTTSEEYRSIADNLADVIRDEIGGRQIPAFSIALVDGDRIVWAEGFGIADSESGAKATANTIYRVGSLSKLFTDLAVMQQVEKGALDLDRPVNAYLPEFAPKNPFGGEITLRRLMSHRSGLVRESPVGNYFDPTDPGMAATLASLNSTSLVYAPGTKTKYSNAAISVVGSVLEAATKSPFEAHIQRSLLKPLGMESSTYLRVAADQGRVCEGWMWSQDGQRFVAPPFDLGTLPAGNLYSTVNDLSRFLTAMFRRGVSDGGQTVIQSATLDEMWKPQGDANDYGIGFGLSKLDGHRTFGHGGAVYGFATQIKGLPDEKLGVVAVASLDCANGFVSRIVDHTLRMMLTQKQGKPLPVLEKTGPIDDPRLAAALEGVFRHEQETAELQKRGSRLFLKEGARLAELRRLGDDEFIVDDVLAYGPKVKFPSNDEFVLGDKSFTRVQDPLPDAPPKHWLGLIGEYGWDHNTLYIYEDRGRLRALIEWFYDYPLTELSPDEYAFPDFGLYHGEKLLFHRDAKGRADKVVAAEVTFERRSQTDAAETYRITPQKLIEELRPIAMAAKPPEEQGEFRESDLVEIVKLGATIHLDLRYASENNFLGSRMYQDAKALLQRPAAEAVARAHQRANEHGLGILIHDAYRPWFVTRMFWDATPADLRRFVADPSKGSRHNRGAAVDLTFYDLKTNQPVQMVSGYDEFTTRAYPHYPGGTSRERWYRDLLRRLMEEQGFAVYEYEWWHFDFGDWRTYRIQNVPFAETVK